MKPTKPSVAAELLRGLEELVETMEADEDITEKFKVRTAGRTPNGQPVSPAAVTRLRTELAVDENAFAAFLGVSVRTLRGWEQGQTAPGPTANRFLEEIRGNTDYYRRRLSEVVGERGQKVVVGV